MVMRLLRRLFGCRHRETYRERRPIAGVSMDVMHLVCHACGHAAPMVDRSIDEHMAIAVTEATLAQRRRRVTSAAVERFPTANGRRQRRAR